MKTCPDCGQTAGHHANCPAHPDDDTAKTLTVKQALAHVERLRREPHRNSRLSWPDGELLLDAACVLAEEVDLLSYLVNGFRYRLKEGCVIFATNPQNPVLERLADGMIKGNITFHQTMLAENEELRELCDILRSFAEDLAGEWQWKRTAKAGERNNRDILGLDAAIAAAKNRAT
jgi:hypothetical protein